MRLKFSYVLVTVAMLFCRSLSLERKAYGYVDPGSGFLAVQTIASVAAAFGYFLRRRIANLFSKKSDAILVPGGLQKGEQRRAE